VLYNRARGRGGGGGGVSAMHIALLSCVWVRWLGTMHQPHLTGGLHCLVLSTLGCWSVANSKAPGLMEFTFVSLALGCSPGRQFYACCQQRVFV
jgi:hypothetical protein